MVMKKEATWISLFIVFFNSAHVIRSQIIFEVEEEQHAPVFLGNIAVKASITSIPDLDFSLLSRKELFDLDESSGDFRTKTILDREILCGSVPKCVVTTSVAVSSAPDFFQRYTVSVVILDANDQKPNFGMASFPRSISERADINATIKLPVAYDGDFEPLFKVQRYHLEPQSQKTFGLTVQRHNKSDGSVEFDLHLRLLHKIDREAIATYTMTLVASDGERPSNEGRLQVIISVIDENDNEPKFQQLEYDKSVKEIVSVSTTVLNVSAVDADDGENSRVGYEFSNDVDRKVLDYFEIDRVSGGVKIVGSLEKEGGTIFSFSIRAFDHGTPMMFSEANVKISVEDTVNNPPSISISQWRSKNGRAVVSEDVVIGTKVALIDVIDTDSGHNGETRCTARSEYFTLEEYNNLGEYTVSVAKDLDREKADMHSITVQCTDNGNPPLSSTATLNVIVEDINDNRPVFTRRSYEMTVKENQEAGVPVGSVFAIDIDEGSNAIVRYMLESGVDEFELNEYSGYLYTSVKDLDREVSDKYIFEVLAFDLSSSPLTSTATVTVNIEDLNDEYPRFNNSTYKFVVFENADNNSIIGQVLATDLDLGLGGVVEYLFVHSSTHPDPPFFLSQTDGVITLTQPLDYETTTLYNLVVTAVDLGKPPRNSSVEIQIQVLDENDNAPVIVFPSKDNLSVTLNLQVASGLEVIRVIAHDPDSGENGRLTYSLSAPNSLAAKFFWINEETGLLTLVAPLTEADVRSFNVVISVNDNGFPQRAAHALLQVEITQQGEVKSSKISYTVIVIIMVCVTLFISVIVLIIFCFIRFIDNRKFYSDRSTHKLTFEPINKTPEDHPQNRSGNDDLEQNIVITTPSIQKPSQSSQSQLSSSKIRNCKKSVTFDNAVRSSDISSNLEPACTQLNSSFNSDGSAYNISTQRMLHGSFIPSTFQPFGSNNINKSKTYPPLHPPSFSDKTTHSGPSCYSWNITSANSDKTLVDLSGNVNSKCREKYKEVQTSDKMVDVALQKHNALVRAMRSTDETPTDAMRKLYPESEGHDLDMCSSSSGETSDSGHGGSEPDFTLSKMGM